LLYWSEGENGGFTNRKLSMFDYKGEVIWDKTLLDEYQYSAGGNLEKTLDDNLVMGYRTNTWAAGISQGAAVSKLDNDGEEIWRRDFHTSDFSGPIKVETFLNGGYVAAWVKDTFINADDNGNLTMLIGLDSIGNTEWEYYFSVPALRFIEEMTIAANGDIIGCGNDSNHDFGVGWIFRMTAEGELLWLRQYADTTIETANIFHLSDIIETSDGGLASVGMIPTIENGFVNAKVWLLKTDANGCLDEDCERPYVITDVKECPNLGLNEKEYFTATSNPVEKDVYLEFEDLPTENAEVFVFDQYGKKLLTTKLAVGVAIQKIDLANFANGNYFITYFKEGKLLQTVSMVKTK
jgi:hypothetical protein